jgi:hypothetical protein
MFDTVVEKVIAEIDQLDSEQQKEVLEHLEKKVNGKHRSGAASVPETASAVSSPINALIIYVEPPESLQRSDLNHDIHQNH